jgi:DNA-binding CsgD family transcriptional regulator
MEDLIAAIYEAAFIPENWPSVLERIAHISGCVGGQLFIAERQKILRWVGSDNFMNEVTEEYIEAGWDKRNARIPRGIALNRNAFITDLDIFTVEELDQDPSYTKFLRPKGLGWGIGSHIPIGENNFAVFSFERSISAGNARRENVYFLNLIRPHLYRAVLLSLNNRLRETASLMETLETIGFPAVAVNRNCKCLISNNLYCKKFSSQSQMVCDISLTDAVNSSRLRETVGSGRAASIFMHAAESSDSFIVHVIPVSSAAYDLFSEVSAVIIFTSTTAEQPYEISSLSSIFGLTKAEAKLARGLGEGLRVADYADRQGISIETARSHLKSVFRKTGVGRQSELTKLMAEINKIRVYNNK